MHDCDGICVSFHEFEQVCMLDKERTRNVNLHLELLVSRQIDCERKA